LEAVTKLLRVSACLALSVLASPGFSAIPEPASDRVPAEIQRLGDDRYAVREEATKRLWEMGKPALPRLREATSHTDPEIVRRAKLLIRKIELEITPDTEPEVLALVERYGHATPDEKAQLLQELRRHSAWKQMLRLFRDEQDAALRGRLQGMIQNVAIEAARLKLVAGKDEDARELLELAPGEGVGLIALAEFHRHRGTLHGELEKATRPAWRVALLRVSGDLARARAEAAAMGDLKTVAILALVDGDPLPWLDLFENAEGSRGGARTYLRLARKRWTGEALTGDDLAPLRDLLKMDDDNVRATARQFLFLLGQNGIAEESLLKDDPKSAFNHFDLLERVPEALRAFGLDPAQPDYKGWIAKRFEAFLRDPDEATNESEELQMMAAFLNRRGLTAEFAAFDEPLAKLAETAPEAFADFLTGMFNRDELSNGAIKLARGIAVNYAKDDDAKWAELPGLALGETSMSGEWWDWLGQLDPQATPADRFDALLALFRVGGDPRHLRAGWLKKIWAGIEKLPADQARPKLAMIVQLALTARDLDNGLRAWDRLGDQPVMGDLETDGRLVYFSAAGRWDRVSGLWLKWVEDNPGRVEVHAYAAASLRRAGRLKEAAEQDAWTEKLALGEAGSVYRIGQAYAYGGDFQRAAQWWQRAMRQATPETNNWDQLLEGHLNQMVETRDWKRAAAAGEVMASIHAAGGSRKSPLELLRLRVGADFPRALAQLGANREQAWAQLENCHRLIPADGSLADSFFPALRAAGLKKEHDTLFERTWAMLQPVLAAYPDGANTCNTAAWLAGRAALHLDEAQVLIQRALADAPEQAAYLDTFGEIWFARGDRKKALEWSTRAIASDPIDSSLRQQNERFRSAPMPTW
jgi:tetratricopeptide (TPR) repeat protein